MYANVERKGRGRRGGWPAVRSPSGWVDTNPKRMACNVPRGCESRTGLSCQTMTRPTKKMPQRHCESEANVLCATESRPTGTGSDLTWRAYIKNSNLCRLSPIVWSAHISRFGCDWRGGRIGFCVLMKINRAVTHILVNFTM